MMLRLVTRAALVDAASSGGASLPENAVYRRAESTEIKGVDRETMSADFTISDATVDRMNDVVNPDGWDLSAYVKNPVVLWGHDHQIMPIGRATNLRVEDGRLKATVVFDGNDNRAKMAFEKVAGGFINATSVGFIPKEYAPSKDAARPYGIDFIKQELIEFSLVSVPANPSALIEDSASVDVSDPAPALQSPGVAVHPVRAMGARLRLRPRSPLPID